MPKITRIKAKDNSRAGKKAEREGEKDKRKARKLAEKKITAEPVKSEGAKGGDGKAEAKAETKAVAKADAKTSVKVDEKVDSKVKNTDKKTKNESSEKKPFILIRPLVYFFRYLRDSWKELRQVRWPNRKATWKMVLAVVVYTAIFMAIISLLDLLFKWLFGLVLSK